jgi:hypothetical protein
MKLRSAIIVAERRKTFKGDLVSCDKLGRLKSMTAQGKTEKIEKPKRLQNVPFCGIL